MARKKKAAPPKKRNIIARDTPPRPSGPMKDKRELSRQEQKIRDKKRDREEG